MNDRALIANVCKICGGAFNIRELSMSEANILANITEFRPNPPIENVCCPICMEKVREYLEKNSSQE